MTRDELVSEFINIQHGPKETVFLVARILWDVETPRIEWSRYSRFDAAVTDEAKGNEIGKILADPKYFLTCGECFELNPVGWMFDTLCCQSCAEANHGVVF